MNDAERLQALEKRIKELVPSFEVRFKDESPFMKLLGKVMFFNKNFMSGYITTIGTKVYFPTREAYHGDPRNSFRVLAHEFVHVFDYVLNPAKFALGYLFPQVLFPLAVFAFLGFLSPWFLTFLVFLLCLAPIPSPMRTHWELRGHGMGLKVEQWWGEPPEALDQAVSWSASHFVTADYWFMWPWRAEVENRLTSWLVNDNCLDDRNVAYKEVHTLVKTQ